MKNDYTLLNTKEYAKKIKRSPRRVRQLIQGNKLTKGHIPFKHGRDWIIKIEK